MYLRQSKRYGKNVNIIHPGELFVSKENELIGTLLGSCIAVCLHDQDKGISGMNHYMLPGRISERDVFSDRSARYGITAIKQLFHEMEKIGAEKSQLSAKIFGGGHVLSDNGGSISIPLDNIRLARIILELEDIPIEQSDVGDKFTRKILMDVKTGKVYLKKSTKETIYKKIATQEKNFVMSMVTQNESE